MTLKPLPIGVDNFEGLITERYYYVDKTLFIKEIINNKASVNLFTRPRRFGKTLNMSMLQCFFEDRSFFHPKKDYRYLFDNLLIMQENEQYLSYMGKYPVINITLKSAKQPNFKSAYTKLKEELVNEFDRHRYILKSDKIDDKRKVLYESILAEEADIDRYSSSLKFLSECLYNHHNEKVIILIDEYDVPLENSYFNGFYDEMISFIRSLFESALKTNPYLYFSVITGCLRISKESVFTGLNNLEVISVLNHMYDEYFGFTEKEATDILKYYNLEFNADLIKSWYNGYIFGASTVYNPWSFINYVKNLHANPKQSPTPYWVNTSSNDIIRKLIDISDESEKMEIEHLISGGTITKPIHEDITYNEILNNMDNLWNFLFFTGYLKKIDERFENNKIYAVLKIPNNELLYIYEEKIMNWFEERIKAKDLSRMYTAILSKDTECFEEELSMLLADTISYHDSGESFYHGFLLGSLALMKGFIVKSNREAGNGRTDIFIMHPSVKKQAVILELKIAKTFKNLDKKCDEALKQIEDKKYDYELKQIGYSNIIKYGISFYRKDCAVKV